MKKRNEIKGPTPRIQLPYVSSEDAAWMAGWISADGCIGDKNSRGSLGSPTVKFKLVDKDPLDRFVEILNKGSVSGPHDPTGLGKKQTYSLSYTSHFASAIIHRVWPWLSSRRQKRYNEIVSRWNAYSGHGHKLTDKDVVQIKEEFKTPYHGQGVDLAKRFNVSNGMIGHIKKGITWKDEEPPKKVIYLAGAMRKIKFYNFLAFFAKEKELLADGWFVINPAQYDMDNGIDPFKFPADFDWSQEPKGRLREIARRDVLAIIDRCDAIYLMKGWEDSVGATAELAIAKWLQLTIIYQED